jgi:hypothetical protein
MLVLCCGCRAVMLSLLRWRFRPVGLRLGSQIEIHDQFCVVDLVAELTMLMSMGRCSAVLCLRR